MNINQVWTEWNEDCVLGEGSFGKVYRAKRVEYGRTFYSAIKVLTVPKSQQEIKMARSQGMNDSEIYAYFQSLVDNLLNEITLMDNLKGAKNVVGIEDYKIIEHQGEIGWDIFIRMELLTPFDSFVSNPEFSQKDVIKLGVDICTALEGCEQNNIVHRDIKPDNIFISRFGEYKLGDFGIARKLEATKANLSRKGTLNYMAPEVYKSQEYGSNVDIYSLGLVLYTLLNNNRIAFLPPYPQPITYKDNEEALSRRLSGEPLVSPCNASASLGAVIVKACSYNAQDRYQTASEFKNALLQEWNQIVQSGDNKGLNAEALYVENNLNQRLQNTTNDMTANGRLIVDGYNQETTVLENGSRYAGGNYTDNRDVYSGSADYTVPDTYSASKSNTVCRLLAWGLSLVAGILGIILLVGKDSGATQQFLGFSMVGLGVSVLIGDRNKIAVGIYSIVASFAYVLQSIPVLFGGVNQGIPVDAVISLLSGILMLFAGVVIITQREVRFGGSLCLYSIVVEWLYNVYLMIYGAFEVELWHIFFGIAAFAIFVWSYGYKSDDELTGVRKILHFVPYAIAMVIAIRTIVFVANSLTSIF